MGRQCSFPGCKNTSGLHSFPADTEIKRQWLCALGLPANQDLPSRAGVCNIHFSRDCFSNLMEVDMGFSKLPMLKSNAVPNIDLPVPTRRPPSHQRYLLPATPLHLEPKLTKEGACQAGPVRTAQHADGQANLKLNRKKEVKRNVEPVKKKVEEALAMEFFFTELNTTATCLICKQKVLFKEYNMKRHYIAKHAGEYDKYKGRRRKIMSDELHADFNRSIGTKVEPSLGRECEPPQISQAMPSLKLISATDTQYSAAVLKSMNEQRNHGLFCDVTIIIQDKKFRAHKTILSASSTYFHQLFSVAGQVIELNFIKAEIFEEILNYIYTSKIVRVRSDVLEELINAGQILGVKFIANLGSPLSQVKGLPGLSKETENKTEMMPIITESFSISAEEFNQTSRPAGNDEDSDNDVMFVSQTDAQTRAANQTPSPDEVIDLDTADSENAASTQKEESNHAVAKHKEKARPPLKTYATKPPSISCPNPSLPNSSPLRSPDSSSNNSSSPARMSSGSAPTTPARSSSLTPEPSSASQSSENNDLMGVHKKQVSASSQQGDFKIRILDVSEGQANQANSPKSAIAAKKTVTLNTATEIDSISSGCKVYANIGEDTYDIVPVKEDPDEGGSKANKGKRSLMATPLKPLDKTPMSQKSSPNKKRAKTELEDHYELIMDGKTFYVCIVCKRPYVCLTSLRRHFNTHSWEKKYPCRYCNKVFALAEYRTKHEIHHTGERRYQCLVCNDMFMNYQLLSTHCKQVHNQDPSGRKEKDEADNNLYRLLPCKTVQMRSYSWSTDGPGVPVISEDGSVHHITSVGEDVHSSTQSRMLNWDDIFIEPDAHMPPDAQAGPGSAMNSPRQGATEFDFVIPETY